MAKEIIEIIIDKGLSKPKERMMLDGKPEYTIEGTLFTLRHDSDGTCHMEVHLGDAMMKVTMNPGAEHRYAVTSANGPIIDIVHHAE